MRPGARDNSESGALSSSIMSETDLPSGRTKVRRERFRSLRTLKRNLTETFGPVTVESAAGTVSSKTAWERIEGLRPTRQLMTIAAINQAQGHFWFMAILCPFPSQW